MGETAYRIRLSVPLGQREGTLRLREDDGRISGFLEVMERKNPLSGTLHEGGQVALTGAIQTLMSTVPYTAAGTVSGRRILLNLKTASGIYYRICGEELSPDDEIL